MILIRTNAFKRDYKKLPSDIQTQTDIKLKLFVKNIAHPSLRVKRVQKYKGVFEASVTANYRFFFQITPDSYTLLRIGKHDLLQKI